MTKNQTHLHLQEWAPIVYQPNQAEPMEFFQTRIVNEWNHLGSCMPTKCILFTINIGPSDHVFHDVQPAFDWSHQHPPINDGKSGFGGKGHALTGANTSRVDLPTKHTNGCILRVRLKQWIQNETEILKCPYLITCSRMRVDWGEWLKFINKGIDIKWNL